jgi:PadR family transcriptional regulator PadR
VIKSTCFKLFDPSSYALLFFLKLILIFLQQCNTFFFSKKASCSLKAPSIATITHTTIHLLIPLHILDIRYTAGRCIYIYRIPDILYYCMGRFSDVDDNYCCDMRGMLGFLILFLLSEKPMHGQELADEIARRREEKPSPGTIYPALKNLREKGFISSDEIESKTIVYTLTERGKNALRTSKRRFIRTFLGVFPYSHRYSIYL